MIGFDEALRESKLCVPCSALSVARFTAFNAEERRTHNGQQETLHLDSGNPFPNHPISEASCLTIIPVVSC